MKKTKKTISVLFAGLALTIGIAISGGIIRNSYVADEVKAASKTAQLVTSAASLVAGDKIVIAGYDNSSTGSPVGNYSISITQNGNNRSAQSVTVSSNTVTFDDTTTEVFTLGGSSGAWTLYANTTPGYLYAAGGSTNNYLRTRAADSDGDSKWAITITSNLAAITAQGTATRNRLKINPTNNPTIFACYSSGQIDASIYRVDPSKTLTGITITNAPNKVDYYLGESFDKTGMVVTASYDAGDPEAISGYTWSPSGSLAITDTQVEIQFTFGGITKTAIQAITVSNRTVSSISVTTNPTKMTYAIGQSFSPAGMVITATYDFGEPVVGYTNYSYSPNGALNSVGVNTITITSLDNALATASLQIQVSASQTISIVVADTGAAISPYQTKTFTKNEITFVMANILKNGDYIQFHDGDFSMHNSTTLPGTLSKITIHQVGGTPNSMTLYSGTSSQASVTTGGTASAFDSVSKTFSWDINGGLGHKYFRLFNFSGSGTMTFSSIEIEYTLPPEANAEAVTYGTSFLSATSTGCSAKSSAQLSDAWSGLETSYNALSSEAKAYLSSLTPNENGNDAEHAVARYIYIVGKYSLNNYMSLVILGSSPVGNLEKVDVMQIMTVAIVSAIGFAVLLSYLYVNKKKQS